MGTWSKIMLSGASKGQEIAVAATSPSAAGVVHTPITGSNNSLDEVYVYAHNTVTTAVMLKLTVSVTGATGSIISYLLPAGELAGLQLVIPGLPYNGGPSGAVRAFATTANQILLYGYVNRFSS